MKFLILLLSCSTCLAQFPYSGATWALHSGTVSNNTILSIPGLAAWWVSSDLPLNITVSNWVDRIQGNNFTNSLPARWPTNSASGIHFDGSQQLTNVVPLVVSDPSRSYSNTFCFILKPSRVNQAFNVLFMSIGGGSGYFIDSTRGWFYYPPNATGVAGLVADTQYDFLHTGDGAFGGSMYTNGVAGLTGMGNKFNSTGPFNGLAYDNVDNWYLGYIREVIWWTNRLNDLQVSNVHYYATNTYGYTP